MFPAGLIQAASAFITEAVDGINCWILHPRALQQLAQPTYKIKLIETSATRLVIPPDQMDLIGVFYLRQNDTKRLPTGGSSWH